jgi:hypothetical protein
MLNDINQNSIVSNTYRYYTQVLQLYNIFAVIINLFFFYLTNVIIISFTKRLSNLLASNAYCCIPIVEYIQLYPKPLYRLSLKHPYKPVYLLQTLCIRLHVVYIVTLKYLQRKILTEQLYID